jgi:hypothetical protein
VNLDFWQTPKSWPSDSPEYVFLARAFNQIGHAIFGPKWDLPEDVSAEEREQDPNEDDSGEDALDNDNWDTDNDNDWDSTLEKMQADVEREIAKQCLAGILVTAVRPKAGGKMTKLKPSHWHTENYNARFYCCQMSLKHPFPRVGVVTSSGSHWIYVTRKSLDRYVAGQPYAESRLNALGKEELPAPKDEKPNGWNRADEAHFEKMAELLKKGKALNIPDASRQVAPEAAGRGTTQSIAKRLERGYRKWTLPKNG